MDICLLLECFFLVLRIKSFTIKAMEQYFKSAEETCLISAAITSKLTFLIRNIQNFSHSFRYIKLVFLGYSLGKETETNQEVKQFKETKP